MIHKEFDVFFLDRDGVINVNRFVNTVADFEFLPHSLEALQLLHKLGKKVFVVTNQGGIEAGYLTEDTLADIHHKMCTDCTDAGGHIEKIYYCPHLTDCDFRKPKPGMLLQALTQYNLQDAKDQCCFVGDHFTDWEADLAAGIQPIAVISGREWDETHWNLVIQHQIPYYFTLYDVVMQYA